jgi:hypothetical protein
MHERRGLTKNFNWFVNKLLITTYRFNLTTIDSDYHNLVKAFYQSIVSQFYALEAKTKSTPTHSESAL